jgi:hypothetical protein
MEMASYGLCKDEFVETENWPPQLYVRESVRMVTDYMLIEGASHAPLSVVEGRNCTLPLGQSVGLGNWGIDVHQVQRVALQDLRDGHWRTVDEGDLEVHAGEFEVPFGSIVPKAGEVANLLVPICIATSHLGYGAYRLESPYMVVGHSAGVAAAMALHAKAAVQEISMADLAALLVKQGQVLTMADVVPSPRPHPGGDAPLSLGTCTLPMANVTLQRSTGLLRTWGPGFSSGDCASVMGYSTSNNAAIVAATCHQQDKSKPHQNQEWRGVPMGTPPAVGICLLMASKDGCKQAAGNKCVGRSGKQIVLGDCADTASAAWTDDGTSFKADNGSCLVASSREFDRASRKTDDADDSARGPPAWTEPVASVWPWATQPCEAGAPCSNWSSTFEPPSKGDIGVTVKLKTDEVDDDEQRKSLMPTKTDEVELAASQDRRGNGQSVSLPATAVSGKQVFAHYMLCFAAFGEKGTSANATAGYRQEMAVAQANGLDGFAIEYLGHDSYYLPSAIGMFAACKAYNAALPPGGKPFQLFVIINFCCGLNLTDAVSLYERFHNSSCAHQIDDRPVFSSWAAVDSRVSFEESAQQWEATFYAPIEAAGLPRPFFLPFIYPRNYSHAESPNLEQQRAIISGFGSAMDGLWYWGCAPLADAVVNSSRATVQACREAGKYVATPVSGPYSPHVGPRGHGNNRYTPSHGGKAVADTWAEHIASQPDMVIFTTWNDLGEHHYVGPYNLHRYDDKLWPKYDKPNAYPHLAYLELSSYFIAWYKLPAGSPAPPVTEESLFYFYNLQPANNSCPGDPVGPPSINFHDPNFPIEDKLYATLLINSSAELTLTSGAAAPVIFHAPVGLQSFEVPRLPGAQVLKVTRGGVVLADVTGSEVVNASDNPAVLARCDHQTFTGSALLAPPIARLKFDDEHKPCSVRVCPAHAAGTPNATVGATSSGAMMVATSLAAAQIAIARLRQAEPVLCGFVEVILCLDAIYVLDRPLIFTAADSNARWRSENSNVAATISSEVPLSDWTPETRLGTGVYRTTLPADLATATPEAAAMRHLWKKVPGQLGHRQKRTSLEGLASSCGTFADYASGCMSFPLPTGEIMSLAWGGNSTGAPAFTTASSWPLNWSTGVEFVFSRVGVPWIESRCAVAGVAQLPSGGAAITLAQPCWDWFMERGCKSHAPFPCEHASRSPTVGGGLHPRRIENIPDLLEAQPGRFASQGGELFYSLSHGETKPPGTAGWTGQPGTTLSLAGSHALVEGRAGVTNLHFQGITFEMSARGPRPDSPTGHVETQTGYYSCHANDSAAVVGTNSSNRFLAAVSAAVHFEGAHGVQFSGCTFRNMGGSGL